jgi:DNA-binding winged helix-turn-helix (wHTH) protein/ABC-type dipeptide/oligopeptide/nickel transport system ATPase component
MPQPEFPFKEMRERVLADMAAGHCVSIIGLSNTGKSMLMRSLVDEESQRSYKKISGREGYLVYIDCNRAVAISDQAFYEVVLRSILENLSGRIKSTLIPTLREHHQTITEADSSFTASLSFNLALSDLCEQVEQDLCLLFDEFGEIYADLDERALLNLRALRDRFHDRLVYAAATERSLSELRGESVEDEFAELFSRFTYPMPLLTEAEMELLLDRLDLSGIPAAARSKIHELAGGHPGMLIAVAQLLANTSRDRKVDPEYLARVEPQPRAECLKLWSQLENNDREALISIVLEPNAGLPPRQIHRLERLGLLREGKPFSPIFTDFIARKGRGAEVEAQGVFLDSDSGDVWVEGIRVPVLTDLEYRLLDLLYTRRDKLTDKYQIVTAVWGEDYLGSVDDARVEKLISRLRSKIEPDPSEPSYLITRRGRGYKLLSASGKS